MAKFCGKDLGIQKEDTPGSDTWTLVATMRSTGVTINDEQVDVTTKTDSNWRELLEACGIRSMSLSASGIMSDAQVLEDLITAITNGTILNYRIVSGVGDRFQGAFQIASFERTGPYNGAEEYSVSLESAGIISYTAAP